MAEEDREMREEGTPETQRHRIKRKEEASLISSEKMRRCESFQTKEAVAEEAEKSGGERERSFTMADFDHLLDEVQKEAYGKEGRDPGWCRGNSQKRKELVACSEDGSKAEDSQKEKEFDAKTKEGSSKEFEDDSQKSGEEIQDQIRTRLAGLGKNCTVGELGSLVIHVLELLEIHSQQCRPGSTTRKFDLFPLPVPRQGLPVSGRHPFLQALVMCLNSLHGCGEVGTGGALSQPARVVLKRLESVVEGSHILDEVLPEMDFAKFFTLKGLDYAGEEVKLAQPISWRSVEASLPPEAGSLDIRDFCTGGVLHFINNIEETIVSVDLQTPMKCPSVMVCEGDWEPLARGLVDRGLCKIVCQEELHHIGSQPLLNGLFSVGKDEIKNSIPVSRLIMNLKPWNSISRSLAAEVGTLPSITQMGALYIHDSEVMVTSSEDLRCFFYLFKVPQAWCRFMGFGREIPPTMVPLDGKNKKWYLAGTVLPMGYLNSVGIAQHIHRGVITRALGSLAGLGKTVQEIRRDRIFSACSNLFRVYLDNFDQLQKLDRATALLVSGSTSDLVEQIREFYGKSQLPRHPKKSVEQALQAEVQGAWVDGDLGTITAKPSKVAKYIRLALEIVGRGKASQRELQVVGGGFVYIAMFRRPLLSSLNQIWRTIVEEAPRLPHSRLPLKREVMIELIRFIGLCPLSFINLRGEFDEVVTASDASTTGGEICRSKGLTPYGHSASLSQVRGDIPEEHELTQVLSVGLFDGISALRVALDLVKAPMAGHISVERSPEARRVVEAHFPESESYDNVELITEEVVRNWSLKYATVGLVLVGSGPPCQGVSGLNSDRKGALRDHRSKLFTHVPRIVSICKRWFPWAQVHSLTENVASMDKGDCAAMNAEYDSQPWFIDADGISLAHRPRLYWITWELMEEEGVEIYLGTNGQLPLLGEVVLKAPVEEKAFLEPGWRRTGEKALPTFTTSRPSSKPLRRPAGLKDCDEEELARWREDSHRFPPYQYKTCHCLIDNQGSLRTPSVREREVILGFPPNYTRQCMKKSEHGTVHHNDCRLSLLGNSWSVGVVAWLVGQLLKPLGIISPFSLAQLVTNITPGRQADLQSLLLRPPLIQGTKTMCSSSRLVAKLSGLVSLKGEDLLLQSTTEIPVKYHRLRAGIPAKLWRWATVAGWQWGGDVEHINVLEARAVLTTIKRRVFQKLQVNLRCIHLVDSLVVLHALTRGRSSSRKMRRTMMRISAYLLASGLQPVWAYVDTKDNPADRPSRWRVKKRWVKK